MNPHDHQAPLTGRKVLLITLGFFGVIIAVNLTLAVQAVRTFPGLEVDNSYIASQTFNAEMAAQKALGWNLAVQADRGRISLAFTDAAGRPVRPRSVAAGIGRATETADDRNAVFAYVSGTYEADVDLLPGKWVLRVEALAEDGTPFRQRITIQLKG